MSKPTGGKPGRPPTPPAIPRAPRPTDPIAAVVWDMESEAAKEKPNATKAGLYGKQLEALTRERDRADGIASDEQRIELEAARGSITDLETWAAEDEETISGLQQECDTLRQNVTALESKITDTIAVAANDRASYLAQCPACVAAAVTISGLQQECERLQQECESLRKIISEAEALAVKCAHAQCPSSKALQSDLQGEIDRLRDPAAKWNALEKRVREIDEQKAWADGAPARRAALKDRVDQIKRTPRLADLTEEARNSLNAYALTQVRAREKEDLTILAQWDELQKETEAAELKEKCRRLRAELGDVRLKEMLGDARFEELFGKY